MGGEEGWMGRRLVRPPVSPIVEDLGMGEWMVTLVLREIVNIVFPHSG